jgi:hypothetical protein
MIFSLREPTPISEEYLPMSPRDFLPKGESNDLPSHGAAGSLFLELFYL